jgi:hypothetical protein
MAGGNSKDQKLYTKFSFQGYYPSPENLERGDESDDNHNNHHHQQQQRVQGSSHYFPIGSYR